MCHSIDHKQDMSDKSPPSPAPFPSSVHLVSNPPAVQPLVSVSISSFNHHMHADDILDNIFPTADGVTVTKPCSSITLFHPSIPMPMTFWTISFQVLLQRYHILHLYLAILHCRSLHLHPTLLTVSSLQSHLKSYTFTTDFYQSHRIHKRSTLADL